MDASFRNFASLALCAALAACTTDEPLPHETTSLRVEVTAPADLGSDGHRLLDSVRQVTATVQALDELGQPDPTLSGPIDVYVQTLGTVNDTPAHMTLAAGAGTTTIQMPVAFGETFLWFEDVDTSGGRAPTFATGASPPIWYREPFLDDVSTPPDPSNVDDALQHSLLEGKQVKVSGSKYGQNGRLIVTGVYTSGYTVSDVNCATRPCVAPPYGHVFAYSFSRAVDVHGRPVQLGQTLKWVAGGSGEFNGYTELNFPDQEIADTTPDLSLIPAPVVLQPDWFDPDHTERLINLEQVESGLVEVDGARVCPLDRDYTTYSQWKLDIGQGCGTPINVITAGQVPGIDPPKALVGKTLTRVVGTLKTVNLPGFNVWIIQPRISDDITQ